METTKTRKLRLKDALIGLAILAGLLVIVITWTSISLQMDRAAVHDALPAAAAACHKNIDEHLAQYGSPVTYGTDGLANDKLGTNEITVMGDFTVHLTGHDESFVFSCVATRDNDKAPFTAKTDTWPAPKP